MIISLKRFKKNRKYRQIKKMNEENRRREKVLKDTRKIGVVFYKEKKII